MNSLKKILNSALLALAITTVFVACKDDEDDFELKRRFKPAAFEIEEGETSATIKWSRSLFTLPGDVEYVVEISKDSTNFTNVEFTSNTKEPEVIINDTQIDIKTNYFARVKAVGGSGAEDSNWLVSESFQITGEVLVLPVREHDIIIDAVRIRWKPNAVITKIILTPQVGEPKEIVIPSEELAQGEKIVTGLTNNANYTIEVFKDDIGKGSVSFRTKNAYTDANIVDLRGIQGKTGILSDTLNDIPSGSVIYLKRGLKYEFNATSTSKAFSKSVLILSGPDFIEEYAQININGTSLNIVANSTIDSLVFKDIIIRGTRKEESYNGDYLFNINAIGTIKKMKFEGCRVRVLRGVVRMQAGTTGTKVENYLINNCVMDSIREYGIGTANNSNLFANIKVSNSTFYRFRKLLDLRVAGNNSLVLENCTLNEVPAAGPAGSPNFLIDFNTFGSANPIVINNCVIGKTWIETNGTTDGGAIRVTGTNVSATSTYVLSDFITNNESYKITGASAYTGASTAVFADPAKGDFKIKDTAFPGARSAGDPRWR
ncbi:DUF5123 domain-containing protein [Chryseosolibacter indicus]|uniref:Fibronectin type III domain-containing protein n=1 Tax=Chryseosolibacter indicus TaxID=2782351 RepID=A0ABS5VST6_9BACT|nr:DUF5123 domain-containing protein [Chryseosolibacter indicus]MBT1703934.1 fibronectin type III domain-containing protein [Chryseosolibacter indicus]